MSAQSKIATHLQEQSTAQKNIGRLLVKCLR